MNKQSDLPSHALAKMEAQPPATLGLGSVNVSMLLERAIDSKAAVEIIKELRQMASEDRALMAKRDFDLAMKAFQAECPAIVKNKGVPDRNGKIAYNFAPIEEVEAVIRPICQKHGFSHKFPNMELGQGSVTVFVEVKHEGGHSEITKGSYRIGTKTGIMSDTQVDAATETFAKRRVLCNAYGLVLVGEDRDGATKPKAQAPKTNQDDELRALVLELWNLTKAIREPSKNPDKQVQWDLVNQWLYRNEILDSAEDPIKAAPNLDAATFRSVIQKTKEKL